jgi:DNA-binding MarR family transcriptional regulator
MPRRARAQRSASAESAAARARAETASREIGGACLAYRLRRVARALNAVYEEEMRPHGLTIAQVNLLVALTATGGMSPSEVCERMMLEKSTVSRAVERLAALGLVDVLPGEDARTQRLVSSAAGRARLIELLPDWRRAQRRARELLGDAGAGALERLSRALDS